MIKIGYPLPEWHVDQWVNTAEPLSLQTLRGRVLLVLAFQLLCPGCVGIGLPQARRVRAAFPASELMVIGLHTVFEHHEAQGGLPVLKAFLHENRIDFPVGMDANARPGVLPDTMLAYSLEGTPTTLLVDRRGRLRLAKLGHIDDLQLGAAIATLVAEPLADGAGHVSGETASGAGH